MKLVLIKEDSDTWNYIWDWISKHPINEGIEEPMVAMNELDNECWQYMGTFKSIDNRCISEFRHRNHPKNNQLHYIKLSHELPDEDIEKTISMT